MLSMNKWNSGFFNGSWLGADRMIENWPRVDCQIVKNWLYDNNWPWVDQYAQEQIQEQSAQK